jgi:hypothetical protein
LLAAALSLPLSLLLSSLMPSSPLLAARLLPSLLLLLWLARSWCSCGGGGVMMMMMMLLPGPQPTVADATGQQGQLVDEVCCNAFEIRREGLRFRAGDFRAWPWAVHPPPVRPAGGVGRTQFLSRLWSWLRVVLMLDEDGDGSGVD